MDLECLNEWFKQMEAYFLSQKIDSNEEKIKIAIFTLDAHTLVWWEAYLDSIISFE